jgi:hypothetical protein
MKKIFVILIILFSLHATAQDTLTGKCWTPEMDTTEFQNQPWFSNNDYLEHFLDSIGYPAAGSGNRIVGAPQVRFWIPIRFWVYRNDDGTGGPTLPQIQNLMDNLNRRFNQTNNAWIGFYMKCDPFYVNNSTHVIKTFTGASLLMAANNDLGCINVHIIGDFASAGTAGFSIPFLNASMVPSNSYLLGRANGDLAHEIGHVLGLQHTHQYSAWNWKCLTECVSRTRTWPTFNLCPTRLRSNRVCEATGDGLRDTQADDNLVANNSCFYTVNFGNDEWGDSYDNPPAGLQDRPNINNIMSYNSATNCVEQISRLQIGVMLYNLYVFKGANGAAWRNPIHTFDDFEPDNNAEMTLNINRNISVNNIQERNFHQQFNTLPGVPVPVITQCDIDWVRFVAPCTNSLIVSTSAMLNRINANTRLTIFNNTLTQLAQNDDISVSNQFSSIIFNFVAGQEYFIRVENMANLVTGYYNLQIAYTNPIGGITGPNQFCNSSNYTLDNLPAGSVVTWGISPTGTVNPSCLTCPQTTLSRISNGTVTLTATVNSCGTIQVFTRLIRVGGYDQTNPFNTSGPVVWCKNQTASVSVDQTVYPGLINFVWGSPPSGWIRITGGTGNSYIVLRATNSTSPPTGSITVTATDVCGSVTTVGHFMAKGNCTSFKISPNPGTDVVKIEEYDDVTGKLVTESNIKAIEMMDKMGIVHYRQKFNSKTIASSLSIPVKLLRNDMYTVRIFDGIEWKSYKVIVQH